VLVSRLDTLESRPGVCASLVEALGSVSDPRGRQGRRYLLSAILAVTVCAVVVGQRTVLAVFDWAASHADQLAGLGLPVPSYDTIRRSLARIDPDELDQIVGGWALARVKAAHPATRLAVAADGKELRGAKNGGGVQTRLLSAATHGTAAVIGQVSVGPKTNEIPKATDLLDQIGDVAGMVLTLDALHTQDNTARMICERGADYVLTVKRNQPGLLASCLALPWEKARPHTTLTKAHGRTVRHEIRVCPPADIVTFPGVQQVARIIRTNTTANTEETCHIVTSVPARQAGPEQLASWVQGHWTIENKIHWQRDVTYDEDRSQLRRGHGPRVMATLRNTALTCLRLLGTTAITQTQRHLENHPDIAARIIGLHTTTSC
jgi:predicted transposase YbfD/YdcC